MSFTVPTGGEITLRAARRIQMGAVPMVNAEPRPFPTMLRRRRRGLSGLGDIVTYQGTLNPVLAYPPDSSPAQAITIAQAGSGGAVPGTAIAAGPLPTAPKGTPSQDPLDYVSPQAAIAAGLNAQTVYAAWATGMKQFPSQQAAIQAGVDPTIVAQLFKAPKPPGITLGVPTQYLLYAGIGIALLAILGGRRGRR